MTRIIGLHGLPDVKLPDYNYINYGKDIFADTEAGRKKEVCKTVGLLGGVEFKEASLFSNFADWYQHGHGGRLIKAFPSYWITLIDSGRLMGQFVLNDYFYGLNGLSSLTVVKNREYAADLCMLKVSNVYGNLSNVTAQRALDEGIRREGWWRQLHYYARNAFVRSPDEADLLRREQDINGLALQPGARIHIRMGYGSCPNALPIVFNGTITEVPGGEGELEITAMGDGLELLNDTQGDPNQTLGGFFHGSEPQDMLSSIIGARGGLPPSLAGGVMKRFGNWVQRGIYYNYPGFDPDNPLGVVHFGNPFYQIGGEIFGECMQNIYRSNDRGARPGYTHRYDRQDYEPLDNEAPEHMDFTQWLTFVETMSFGQKEFSTELYGKTVWDLVTLSTQVSPDYISAVVPFQFRSSLFFGKTYYPYCYDYKLSQLKVPILGGDSIGAETWGVYGSEQSHWKDETFNSSSIDRKEFFGVTAPGIAQKVKYCRPLKDRALISRTAARNSITEEAAESMIYRKFINAQLRKPFQQVYPINSIDDIIANNITASSEDIYTVVRGKYKSKQIVFNVPLLGNLNPFAGPTDDNGVSADMTLPVYADYTIFPENKKSIAVDTQIYVGRIDIMASIMTQRDPHGNLPNNVATTILKNYMSYMYKGNVVILGIPSIKPHDCIVIDDVYNELHGPVGVRSVVHTLNGGVGLITTIEPDALISIADQRLLKNWSLFRNIGGMFAFQRLALAEAGRKSAIVDRSNIADRIKILLGLIDSYIVGNSAALNKPNANITLAKVTTLRKKYEDVLYLLQEGYYAQQSLYTMSNVSDTILNNKKVHALSDDGNFGAYEFLNVPSFAEEISELRRQNYIINKGKAPRLGLTDNAITNISDAERLLALRLSDEVDTPNYSIPYDIGGPPSAVIYQLSTLLAGQVDSISEDNLISQISYLFKQTNVDDIIIERALDSVMLNEPTKAAWILSKNKEMVLAASKESKEAIATIRSWFSAADYSDREAYIKEKIKNHGKFSKLTQTPILKENLIELLTLARLMIDSKVKGRAISLKTSTDISLSNFENAFYELSKAYTMLLYFENGVTEKENKNETYSAYLVSTLMKEAPYAFSASAHRANDSMALGSLLTGSGHFGRILLANGVLNAVLKHTGLWKLLYNTANVNEWLKGQKKGFFDKFTSVRNFFEQKKLKMDDAEYKEYRDEKDAEINAERNAKKEARDAERAAAKEKAPTTKTGELIDDLVDDTKKTKNSVLDKISRKMRNFYNIADESKDIFQILKDMAKDGKTLGGFLGKLGKGAGPAKAHLFKMLGLAELSNPVGWVMLALQVASTIIVGTLLNKLNCYLANLHACEMVLLKKHGVEFSAGINGHQGLVYGDTVNFMASLFNQLSGKDESDSKDIMGEWQTTGTQALASFIGVRFPYTPEMGKDERTQHKIVDDLFNSRSFVDQTTEVLKSKEKLGDLGALLNALELGETYDYSVIKEPIPESVVKNVTTEKVAKKVEPREPSEEVKTETNTKFGRYVKRKIEEYRLKQENPVRLYSAEIDRKKDVHTVLSGSTLILKGPLRFVCNQDLEWTDITSTTVNCSLYPVLSPSVSKEKTTLEKMWGNKAKQRFIELLRNEEKLKITMMVQPEDNMTDIEVDISGKNGSLVVQLLKEGYLVVDPDTITGNEAYEKIARDAKAGIWSLTGAQAAQRDKDWFKE